MNDTSVTDEEIMAALAETLAVRFTTDAGPRNPEWDWEQPDSPDNAYHLTVPMAERVERSPYIKFTAGDGHPSWTTPSCSELAAALLPTVRHIAEQRAAEELLDAAEELHGIVSARVSLRYRAAALTATPNHGTDATT